MIKQVVRDYRRLFPDDWKPDRHSYVRRAGQWVQVIGLGALLGNSYRCSSSLCYLYVCNSYYRLLLQQRLLGRHKVEHSILIYEHRRNLQGVFDKMAEQFWPPILEPFTIEAAPEIERRLQKGLRRFPNDWAHACALCILAAQRDDRKKAQKYFKAFSQAIRYPDQDWVVEVTEHLEKVLELMESPADLQDYLKSVEEANLTAFKAKI